MRNVDRRDVVQVSAIFFRPSVDSLRISILIILLKLIVIVALSCVSAPLLASTTFH